MKYARWSVSGGCLLAAAAWLWLERSPAGRQDAATAVAAAPAVGGETGQRRLTRAARSSNAQGKRTAHSDSAAATERAVRAELERFKAMAGAISDDALRSERQALERAREEFAAIRSPVPTQRSYVDSAGMVWTELTYPSGEIRYEIAEQDTELTP